jgi:hypothetical protein
VAIEFNRGELVGANNGLMLALYWASKGARVLPVNYDANNPKLKNPLVKAWQDVATTDTDQIERWWQRWPWARVGIATGDPCFDVLDFDVADAKPGLAQMAKLIDLGIIAPRTFYLVTTPSGGRHLYFAGSTQRNKQNEKSIPGVDFRAQGGMVLAAGNPGYELKTTPLDGLRGFDWQTIRAALAPEPAPQTTPLPSPRTNQTAPAGMHAPRPSPVAPVGFRSGKLVAPVRAFDDPVGEESPLDWYTRNHDIDQLLLDAGWRYANEQEGRRYYTRPGKEVSAGVSGNTALMADGRVVFYNFSSSVELPTDTAMSAAQVYGWLFHGGDMRAAASHIRRVMMPRPAPPAVPLVVPAANYDAPPGTPGAPAPASTGELVPVSQVGPPAITREFWDERPELHAIRWLARERRVSPWATLGAVLAMVSCRVGPHVVLPPIVGGVASLNLLVGLVGPSGKGKGAAWSVAAEFLDVMGRFRMEEVGTSQGIDATFTEPSPKVGPVQFNDVAFFYVPEIDTVKAHTDMAGSPLLATLRKIWSGEALGGMYAAKDRRRPVRAHAYRASVVAGIQPARSGVLLGDVDGGTPQRWLWLPVHDPNAIRRRDKLQPPVYSARPPEIDYDVWIPAGEQRGEKDVPEPVELKTRYEIAVCLQARNDILDAREENITTEYGSMDSHSLLTRLKVAALLAFLDRRAEVTDDDWRLAKTIMWISNDTRAKCQRALDEAEEEEHAKKGRGRAIQSASEDVARVTLKDQRVERIQAYGFKALAKLQEKPGEEYSPRGLLKAFMDSKAIAAYGADVLAAVIAVPGVTQGPEISSGGRKIRRLSWRPVIGEPSGGVSPLANHSG